MAQKLNFEKLRHTGKPALSIEDEADRRETHRETIRRLSNGRSGSLNSTIRSTSDFP
jgi:hypothetical protein